MKSIRFFRFVRAAGSLGGGSVGLAILLFSISIEEHLRDKNVPAYWLILTAAVAFTFGAYRAWASEDDAHTSATQKTDKPSLNIELVGAFFDTEKVEGTNALQVLVLAYLKVTNLNFAETLIKDGVLEMTVEGVRYKGAGDNSAVKGNSIEHVTDFRIGGEVSAKLFNGTISPFVRLLSKVNAETPLRRGISQEGFFVFTFTDQLDWSRENPYLIPVTEATLSLRDSFDGIHSIELEPFNIPNGVLTKVARIPRSELNSLRYLH